MSFSLAPENVGKPVFLMFSGGIEREHSLKVGYVKHNVVVKELHCQERCYG